MPNQRPAGSRDVDPRSLRARWSACHRRHDAHADAHPLIVGQRHNPRESPVIPLRDHRQRRTERHRLALPRRQVATRALARAHRSNSDDAQTFATAPRRSDGFPARSQAAEAASAATRPSPCRALNQPRATPRRRSDTSPRQTGKQCCRGESLRQSPCEQARATLRSTTLVNSSNAMSGVSVVSGPWSVAAVVATDSLLSSATDN